MIEVERDRKGFGLSEAILRGVTILHAASARENGRAREPNGCVGSLRNVLECRLSQWGFAPGSAQAEGVCSILRDSHTLSGVERGCLLATAGAGGTAEEPARQQLEPGGELLRLQPPTCVRNPKRAGDNQRATLVTTRELGSGQGG